MEYLRVTVPKSSGDSPYLNYSCLEYDGNSTKAVLKQNTICQNKPGLMIEFPLVFAKFLGLIPEFVVSTGYVHQKDLRGIPDLLESDQADISVAMYYYNELSTLKSSLLYTVPLATQASGCFLICDENLLFQSRTIFDTVKGMGFYFTVFVVITMAATSTFWTLYEGLSAKRSKLRLSWKAKVINIIQNLENCWDAVESKHWIISWASVSLTIFIWRDAYFKGVLMASFSPVKEYPFRSIEHLAEAVSNDEIKMAFPGKWSMFYREIGKIESFNTLHQALHKNPPHFRRIMENPVYRDQLQTIMKRKVFRHSGFLINYYINKPWWYDLNCMCSSLEVGTPIPSGILVNPEKQYLKTEIDQYSQMLREAGFTEHMFRKYFFTEYRFNEMLENHPSHQNYQQSLSFEDFKLPFFFFVVVLGFCVAVLGVEIVLDYASKN